MGWTIGHGKRILRLCDSFLQYHQSLDCGVFVECEKQEKLNNLLEWFDFQKASFGGLKSLDCSGFGLFLSQRLDAGHHRLLEPITYHY